MKGDVQIFGVEMVDGAAPVNTHPFVGHSAFVVSNEGRGGLTYPMLQICDKLVYIPQYGIPTVALDVTVATSIVLQHFSDWANFSQRPFVDSNSRGKYVLDKISYVTGRTIASDTVTKQRAIAKTQFQKQQNSFDSNCALALLASSDY